MVSVASLFRAIDDLTVTQEVSIRHDETRMRYPLMSNRVASFDEFSGIIGDYVNYHNRGCVSLGGTMSVAEATGRAKEILTRHYRQRGGDINTAANDAMEGTNGGMRAILDILADGMRGESIERYMREMFDRHIPPNSWEDKVEAIRQFIEQVGPANLPGITMDPTRYARDYESLIRAFIAGRQKLTSVFRRL
jgi:hypothetical protein